MAQIAPALRKAMYFAFVQQGIILILAGMILDGGAIARYCFAAAAAFWVGVLFMLLRRAETPTKVDLVLVQAGYLLLCPISFFVVNGIWKLKGL